jgi:hypothetical protein
MSNTINWYDVDIDSEFLKLENKFRRVKKKRGSCLKCKLCPNLLKSRWF